MDTLPPLGGLEDTVRGQFDPDLLSTLDEHKWEPDLVRSAMYVMGRRQDPGANFVDWFEVTLTKNKLIMYSAPKGEGVWELHIGPSSGEDYTCLALDLDAFPSQQEILEAMENYIIKLALQYHGEFKRATTKEIEEHHKNRKRPCLT